MSLEIRKLSGLPSCTDTVESKCVACACGRSVVVGSVEVNARTSNKSVSIQQLDAGRSPISCMAFTGTHLATCTDDKELCVWKAEGWKLIGERSVPKRATALDFTKDDQFLLVADKSGDVTSYEVSTLSTAEGKHLLGHSSMILNMILSPSNSHVITCDRDEKIRVSLFPNSYNIETFCLGHTEFISVLTSCVQWPTLLLSGGGDGTVRVWEWQKGQLLHTEEICPHSSHHELNLPVVTHIACSHNTEETLVMVVTESSTDILSFSLSRDGKLSANPDGIIPLTVTPWSIAFDQTDNLWVYLPGQEEPLQCYRLAGLKFIQVPCKDSPLLQEMCKKELYEGCQESAKDWSQLRKHTTDNMSAYLAKKEERIRSRAEAKQLDAGHPAKVPKLESVRAD